ncbi:hypothetical protein [Synechocystis sp. CACIAM 05]|jgi:hypothetical protein|uniref:hypothetical protein n=1 Tax=Synechocystis sp. CACIAM 05 TaxID=1933929 RepID=UPI00138E7C1C|nr:hypothetical protein [Synechocystis sp. CACIAM 05]QHU99577.1 hypothetical protein BWK47_05160 [Synechocystis sp. CACIAM 05]
MIEPAKTTRIWENRIMDYDKDLLNRSVLVRVRFLIGKEPPSPRPSLLEARLLTDEAWKAPSRNGWEPRQLTACFAQPGNQSGQAERTVYNPYRPGAFGHNALIRETFAWPGVLSLSYTGETLNKKYEDFAK